MLTIATSALARLKGFFAHLREDRRLPVMIGLGFASGLPYPLVYITQSAWLSEAGVGIETLGLMSELTIAYKLKFLWAPFLDDYDPPLFAKKFGRRRGWILWAQIGVMLTLAGIAFGDPRNFLAWTVAVTLALGVFGATQDVVIDGWRINAAPVEKQPLMSACAETGWRIGIACSAGVALAIGGHYGFLTAYLAMAAAMLVGVVACFLAPEPEIDFHHRPAPKPARANFFVTIWEPIREMIGRLGPLAAPILIMVAGFRMPGYISNAMAMPLFKSLNYPDAEIALVTKGFGFAVGVAGVFCASLVAKRIGLMKTLIVGTVAGSASHLSLAWLATHGGSFLMLATCVSIDNFAAAFASIVLISYMSSLTVAELAGSQYALLTSLVALPGSLLAGSSGFIIRHTGFAEFFVLTALIGVPVALLSVWVAKRHAVEAPAPAAA